MKIIVGSSALEYFGISPRKPKDVDIWLTDDENKLHLVDAKIMPKNIMGLLPIQYKWNEREYYKYTTPDAIYTIKLSHAMYDIHWYKTISDIIYLKKKGCKIIPELHSKLIEHWKTIHGNKEFLSLKKSKEDFFDDYIKYDIDHDLLHKIVAGQNLPIYIKCLKDNEEVLIDYDKFLKLSKEDQINLFREEIYTIAIERWIIPSKLRMPKVRAYKLALKKTVTNLTKNWATQFILDNIETYSRMGNSTWYDNFLTHIGKDITMHPIIEKVKNKAEEFGIENKITEYLHHAYGYTGNPSVYENADPEKDPFAAYLNSLGFKVLNSEGGEGKGDDASTIIELEGQIFRADFSYSSFDGYYIDDVWDWTPVQAVTKEVTVYE